jgi:hypothetical protein
MAASIAAAVPFIHATDDVEEMLRRIDESAGSHLSQLDLGRRARERQS